MKKDILVLIAILFTSINYGQSIFKGLEYGMSKSDAKKEYKLNKQDYTTVDVGNGFLYRIYQQNFVFDENKLVGVLLTPKGSTFGQSYDDAKNYLIHSRSFFESLNYSTHIENEWWNAPLNYVESGSKWGLVLQKSDKTTMVQMYPISYELSGATKYLVKLMIWHSDTWLGYFEKEEKKQLSKVKDSGFE